MQVETLAPVASSPDEPLARAEASPAVARNVGVDNTRSLIIIGVVLLHAACGYTSFLTWWFVQERSSSLLIDIVAATGSLLLMTPLFFFAGYVTLPALRRHGVRSYWSGRLRRLGLPWALCTLMVSPVLMFIWSRQREFSGSYADYLAVFFGGYRHTFVGVLETYDSLDRHHLWWHHLWFIPVLLLITGGYQLYAWCAGWLDGDADVKVRSVRSILSSCALASLVLFGVASAWIPDYWAQSVVFSSILAIQPSRFSIYASVFAAGLLLARNGHDLSAWPGVRTRRVYAVLLFALIAYLGALASVRDGTATPASWAHWAEAVGVVAASWMAVTAAVRASVDLSRPSRWLAWLTPYSLNIYFIHYLLCVFMHVLLLPLSWSPLFKAAATFMVVLPTSIGLARAPRVAVGALVALQVGLLLYT